ncbi:hypothetical protein D9M70_172370 [compost metagenome]
MSRLTCRPAPVPMVMIRAPQLVAFSAVSIGWPQTRSRTTSKPPAAASFSAATSSVPPRVTTSSAMPRDFRPISASAERAAPTTLPAPMLRASCRAIWPRVPVAPRINTFSPFWIAAFSSGTMAPVAAMPMLIAVLSSTSSGTSHTSAAGTRVRSAQAPNGATERSPKYTRRPSGARPTPSPRITQGYSTPRR